MSVTSELRWPLVCRGAELDDLHRTVVLDRVEAILVAGPAGVGKTRLAEELLLRAAAMGRSTMAVRPSRAAATVPLSAMAPLLPAETSLDADPNAVFVAARAELAAHSSGGRVVVLVDDVDLLDPASLALLDHLAAARALLVVATIRSDAVLPDVVDGWWRAGDLARVDVGPLSRRSVGTLLHLVLGGPVSAQVETALWDATLGNVLHLREAVRSGRSEGAITEVDGVWGLTGPLAVSGGLSHLVARRLDELDDAARVVVERLAVCGLIDLDHLLAVAEYDTLERLEADGLIVVRPVGPRDIVALAHPVHGQVLRESVPRLRRRAILRQHVELLEADGRADDVPRPATWRLDAGMAVDPGLLLRAARTALWAHDLSTAERLAVAVLDQGPDADAELLLGQVRQESADHDGADAAFERAESVASREQRPAIAVARATALFLGRHDTDDALAVLADARERVPEAADLLTATQGSFLAALGRADRADEVLGRTPPDDPRARVVWLRAAAAVAFLHGRLEEAVELARRGVEEHRGLADRSGLPHPLVHVTGAVAALAELGRTGEAQTMLTQALDEAYANRVDTQLPFLLWQQGRLELRRGRTDPAARAFTETMLTGRRQRWTTPVRLGHAGLASAAAYGGDAAEAARQAADAESMPDPANLVSGDDVRRGRAWAEAAAGRLEGAVDLLRAAADAAAGDGRHTAALYLRHDAVRLGSTAEAVEVARLATLVDGPLAAARAGHARALAQADPDALLSVAELLAGLDAPLFAAEAAAQAAQLWRGRGDGRSANAATAAMRAYVEPCGPVATPALAVGGHAVEPLTARELEIAQLAARGRSSREIANALVLSVRTVDNHLQRVYGKLGIAGRPGLVEALPRVPGAPISSSR